MISTRAPTGGATSQMAEWLEGDKHFYSRPHGRGDWSAWPPVPRAPYFYSRPHGRGDCPSMRPKTRELPFLLAPPREGRLFESSSGDDVPYISTRAPTGGATGDPGGHGGGQLISTRAPTGGATPYLLAWLAKGGQFLLAPPREGRLRDGMKVEVCNFISTRAPTGGATIHRHGRQQRVHISTRAPTGGATRRQRPK